MIGIPEGATHSHQPYGGNGRYYRINDGVVEYYAPIGGWCKSRHGAAFILDHCESLIKPKSEQKIRTYIMTVQNGEDIFRVSVDVTPSVKNTAITILTSTCRSALYGFGEAKVGKLYKIIQTGGQLRYKYQGVNVEIDIKVVE